MRSPRLLLGFCALLVSGFGAACVASEDDTVGSSDAAHTERVYANDASPYTWADLSLSYDDFRTGQAQLGQTLAPAIADDDPLTKRLQTWLDRVDAIVRPEIEKQTGAPLPAPKPIAKVLTSKTTWNAWVSGSLACVGAPIGTSATSPATPGTEAYIDFTSAQGVAGASCARPKAWTPSGFVSFWNAAKPTCSLKLGSDGALSFDKSTCSVPAGVLPAAETTIVTTAPYVQFTTDLVADLDETTMAVVAAHELGHYYLGHTTAVGASKYGYWYDVAASRKGKPQRAANSADLEAAYKEVVSPAQPGVVPFGKVYSARMRPLLLQGVLPLLTARTEAGFPCADAAKGVTPFAVDLEAQFPSGDARKAYEDFEKKLATCAAKVTLGEAGATSLSAGEVLFAAGRSRPGPKVKVAMQLGDTLGSFLDRLQKTAAELDQKAARIVQRARQNNYGLYTTEQAADELAMELATKLGFTSDEVVASWAAFMATADRAYLKTVTSDQLEAYYTSIGDLSAAKCKAQLDAGFPGTINLGQLDEPHHASCYRLYNFVREAKAHQYVPGPRQPALEPSWDTLRAEAAQLAASALQ